MNLLPYAQMKKNIILLLVFVSFMPFELFSQTIIKQSRSRYCDCYEGTGESLSMEMFNIKWDKNDLPNGKREDGTFKLYWNTLEKEYICGCNIGNNSKSILIKESYWRNGKEHGIWKEYFKNSKLKTITKFENGTLISKTRYSENDNIFDGKD